MEVRALVKVPIGVDPHKTSVAVVEDPSEAPRKPSYGFRVNSDSSVHRDLRLRPGVDSRFRGNDGEGPGC